jgi:hypothetical protein
MPSKSSPKNVQTPQPMTSQQLTQKAAGYLLASANAAKAEAKTSGGKTIAKK